MILTIELPEDLAATLKRLPEAERNNFAVSALRDKAVVLVEIEDDISQPWIRIPPPGFAKEARLRREAQGDFRTPAQILKDRDAKP